MSESNLTKMKKLRDSIINKSFREGGSDGEEVIDIISDYPWSADTIGKGSNTISFTDNLANDNVNGQTNNTETIGSVNAQLPFCYVVERRSAVNAAIANIFNMLNATNDIMSTATEGVASMGAAGEKIAECLTSAQDSAKNAISQVLDGFNFAELMAKNNLNGEVLNPYRYLYITNPTNKKYVFPLFTDGSTFKPIKNDWSNSNTSLPGWIGQAMDTAQNAIMGVGAGLNFVRNVISVANGAGDDIGTAVDEKAKSYVYPTNGDTVKVSFTLYNTTRPDAWKNNFRFLYLFVFRNLPFRLDTLSFSPPYLYDVIVPGICRYPVCAVSDLSIKPHGLTRLMTLDNFIKGSGTITTAIPEAWEVDISFSSLIGQSGNLMLSSLVGSIGITTALNLNTATTPPAPASTPAPPAAETPA